MLEDAAGDFGAAPPEDELSRDELVERIVQLVARWKRIGRSVSALSSATAIGSKSRTQSTKDRILAREAK